MNCSICIKNKVDRYPGKGLCNSCYVVEYNRAHPGYKARFVYKGNRLKALIRDGYKCRVCFKHQDELLLPLESHHIDGKGSSLPYSKRNDSLENLITLCTKCHYQVELVRRGNPITKGKWAIRFDRCISCGTTKRKHWGKGRCSLCFERGRTEYKANWYKKRVA